MKFSKIISLVVVFALCLATSMFTVGCKEKPKSGWVNTNSLPGQTFSKYNKHSEQQSSSTIVYLGSSNGSNVNFGPKDVSFEFRDLK